MQMDVIDSSYLQWLKIFDNIDVESFSLDETIQQHRTLLKKITSGCFLDQSPTAVTVSKSFEEIVTNSRKFLAVVNEIIQESKTFEKSRFLSFTEVIHINQGIRFAIPFSVRGSVRNPRKQPSVDRAFTHSIRL